jgi:hypothetical protein
MLCLRDILPANRPSWADMSEDDGDVDEFFTPISSPRTSSSEFVVLLLVAIVALVFSIDTIGASSVSVGAMAGFGMRGVELLKRQCIGQELIIHN